MSKNGFLNKENLNKTFLALWLVYHLAFIIFFTIVIAGKSSNGARMDIGGRIDADLFNMLPKPVLSAALEKADEALTERTAKNVFILASNQDFEKAKTAAQSAFDALKTSDCFKSITLQTDTSGLGEVLSTLQKHNSVLLSEGEANAILSEGGAEDFASAALEKAFSGFTTVPMDLEGDPFLLTDACATSYIEKALSASPAMREKDGVLSAYSAKYDRHYVMIRAVLSPKGSALASPDNGVPLIQKVCSKLEVDGTRFIYSGTMFHSYKSSTSAAREIAVISFVSLSVVVVILLLIFRTPLPIVCSVLSIIVSSVVAFCATIAIFGKMHILTLVFGTSLIGSCIDYSLHYFISWKGNALLGGGDQVRAHLLKGLTLSLLSTVLCYFVLLFAPFGLLKQISVFSITGITSTYLSVVCLYPFIKLPKKRNIPIVTNFHAPKFNRKFVGRIVLASLFVIFAGVFALCYKNFHIKNDVKSLYKMEGRELSDEVEAGTVLQYNPSGWFICEGETLEALLQTEESVGEALTASNEGKARGGFVATSSFVPSIKTQARSLKAARALVTLAKSQFEALGFSSEEAEKFSRNYKMRFEGLAKKAKEELATAGLVTGTGGSNESVSKGALGAGKNITDVSGSVVGTGGSVERAGEGGAGASDNSAGIGGSTANIGGSVVGAGDSATSGGGDFGAGEAFLTLGGLPKGLSELLAQNYLGEIDGRYYSVVLPVSVTDLHAYQAIADEIDGVHFISKVTSMNDDLDKLSRLILTLFLFVAVVLFIVLKCFYTLKQTAKIVSVPLLIILCIFSFFSATRTNIEFFSITGMILVFGLALDYVIYMIENDKRVFLKQSQEEKLTDAEARSAKLEPFAILLSFVTTALSFASLSLSSFIPVHNIGLAVFVGLSVSYVATFFYTRASV